MMLWNRKRDFAVEDLDTAAYKEFKITQAFAFKRDMLSGIEEGAEGSARYDHQPNLGVPAFIR